MRTSDAVGLYPDPASIALRSDYLQVSQWLLLKILLSSDLLSPPINDPNAPPHCYFNWMNVTLCVGSFLADSSY